MRSRIAKQFQQPQNRLSCKRACELAHKHLRFNQVGFNFVKSHEFLVKLFAVTCE